MEQRATMSRFIPSERFISIKRKYTGQSSPAPSRGTIQFHTQKANRAGPVGARSQLAYNMPRLTVVGRFDPFQHEFNSNSLRLSAERPRRRGLAYPVRPKEAEDLTLPSPERHRINSRQVAKLLCKVPSIDYRSPPSLTLFVLSSLRFELLN